MINVPEIFGSMVFNDKVMRERLPANIYESLHNTIASGKRLEPDVANVVASAMKDWAVEKGATHFTHWFQPMTGITAEKHESFATPDKHDGVVMEFSGKALIQGEPDASSLPSGGLRATFEARGFTAWDPTSYAFIKDGTLCIPTAFCSFKSEALDKKTPLLRSMQALDGQAKRVLKLFNNNANRVFTAVGAEQEYFLIDKELYNKRPDLINCGRTLFGAKPPKGQEMDDHYFGVIKTRVAEFMRDLDVELWKLGICSKIKHNETAPAQHEIVPVYTTVNIASDNNQLTMELMKSIAARHNLACLLHEKPFAGINGSGKHNNWSMSTDTGVNLLEPGDTPSENAQFLLFLTAVIKAVDDYQDLLRISVSSPGNDHRLGSHEAPPAIISIFLGAELMEILETITSGTVYKGRKKKKLEIGADVIPSFPTESTDRNRTSPFAFTGNRFEFRMLGSALSIAGPNFVLNTAVAETLKQFADALENSKNFREDLSVLIKKTISAHKRILFNGNNYSYEWIKEAAERGLLNIESTVDALPYFLHEKNVNLFVSHSVLTETEIHSRYEILLENYSKTLHIEALTMIDMVKKEILPSSFSYLRELSETAEIKKAVVGAKYIAAEKELILALSTLNDELCSHLKLLEKEIAEVLKIENVLEKAEFYRYRIFKTMNALRAAADAIETLTPKKYQTLPTYFDLLFSVK